jgi:hypothetical protein
VRPDLDAALVQRLDFGFDARKSQLLAVGVQTLTPDEENRRCTRVADLLSGFELSDRKSRCIRALQIVGADVSHRTLDDHPRLPLRTEDKVHLILDRYVQRLRSFNGALTFPRDVRR